MFLERDSLFCTMSSISNVSETSAGIYEDYKRKKIQEIFNYLNHANSPMLTRDTNLRIDPTWPDTLKDIIDKIRDDLNRGISMNFFVFYNKIDIYLSKLTVTQRAQILRRATKKRRQSTH